MGELINGRTREAISLLVEAGDKIGAGLHSDNPEEREIAKIADALIDVSACLARKLPKWIGVEDRLPMRCFGLPKYSQIIEPYYFGDPWKKRTCLWLKGVPPLFATMLVEPKGLWVGSTSARRDPTTKQRYELNSNRDPKRRAKTFPGVARAMAEQMAGKCEKEGSNGADTLEET